jgi:hypothetical protein
MQGTPPTFSSPSSVRILCGAVALIAAGCGGVTQRDVNAGIPPALAPVSVARGLVRIERVENRTGRPECDDLAHYVHLKAAQLLEARGWNVASDELLMEADFLGLAARAADGSQPVRSFAIELVRAEEKAGATVSVALLSSQAQTATVGVRVRLHDVRTGADSLRDGTGASTKGAWGVLAKVNRDALTRREGFWQFDRSLLGNAATEALGKALGSFP